MDREHGRAGERGGGVGGILWMFEDDASGCHSLTVSCAPVTFNSLASLCLPTPVLTVCLCVKRPMKSLQNDDCDRKQQ